MSLSWLATGDAEVVLFGAALAVVGLGAFWFTASRAPFMDWVAAPLFAVLLLITIPICLRLSAGNSAARNVLIAGAVLKLLTIFPRAYVTQVVYDDQADSGVYAEAGRIAYSNFRAGEGLDMSNSSLENFPSETIMIGKVVAVVFLIVGPSRIGGTMVFAWLSLLGSLCAYKAYRLAFPNAPPVMAGVLLLLLPSTLYWPASLGKDALMTFAVGLLALGVARVLSAVRTIRGVGLIAASSVLLLAIRPHMLLIGLVGAALSQLARTQKIGHGRLRGIAGKAILGLLLIPGLSLGLARMNEAFGEPGSPSKVNLSEVLESTKQSSSIGGSAIDSHPIDSPIQVPLALVSVIYRPFVFEANNVPAAVSALEGTILLLATLLSLGWIWRIFRVIVRNPFAAFCFGYTLAFVFAFSNIGNAGILARQRVQLFPMLMLLVLAAREAHLMALASNVPAVSSPTST